jgi:hypothetical protein
LQVAGYRGRGLFSPEALELIAQASEGIPRQINNYCFHALSLACAERKKTVDTEIVLEVMNDLDISRFMTEVEAPLTMTRLSTASGLGPSSGVNGSSENGRDIYQAVPANPLAADSLSPAEAVQHMKDVARLLQNWRSGMVRPSETQPS